MSDREKFPIKSNVVNGVNTIIANEDELDVFISDNSISDVISADFDNNKYYVLKVPSKGSCDSNVKIKKIKYNKDNKVLKVRVKRSANSKDCKTPEPKYFLIPIDKSIKTIKKVEIN